VFNDNALWDCTITDFIGGDDDEDIEIKPVYIRSEGITVGISNFETQTGALWDNFHSHTGTFAVIGGTLKFFGANSLIHGITFIMSRHRTLDLNQISSSHLVIPAFVTMQIGVDATMSPGLDF